ncbi:MAG: hypothetical protein IT431_05485 [Phycisphaerales bacterium]|nr:hypothetical protein [Phycisphaerales bacterium]
MTAHHEHTPGANLSPDGLARKQAILAQLEPTVRRRGRRRTARRAGLAATPLALLAAAWLLTTSRNPSPTPDSPPAIARTDPPEPAPTPDRTPPAPTDAPTDTLTPPPPRVVYVANDPRALDRFAAPTTATRVQRLTDEQLLAELDARGIPAGLIRTEHRVRLAFHNTTILADNRTP